MNPNGRLTGRVDHLERQIAARGGRPAEHIRDLTDGELEAALAQALGLTLEEAAKLTDQELRALAEGRPANGGEA